MATYWVELHCENRGTGLARFPQPRCQSDDNESPGVLVHNLSTAAVRLKHDAKAAGWRRTRAGYFCQGCQANGFVRLEKDGLFIGKSDPGDKIES